MSGTQEQFPVLDVLQDGISFVRLINYMGGDLEVVNSARVSFGKRKEKLDDKDVKLIHYLAKHRHTSPFEHVTFTFHVKSPLFVTRQWHRHRTWSYNEISRRYTSENLEFYIPQQYRRQAERNRQASVDELLTTFQDQNETIESVVRKHVEDSLALYYRLIENGVAREQARMVLPQNMYTEMYATVNLHNLLHFIELRIHPRAQWEIRQFAKGLLTLAEKVAPVSIQAARQAGGW